MGTLGPGLAPLASRPNPRAPKGLGLEESRPRNARPTLRPGTSRGLGPEASRPTNDQPILRPGARVSHIPDAFLTQVLTFLIGNSTKRSCQPALHITSVSLQGSYVKGRISHPSRNKSHLPLALWEEIVYSPKKTDPLSSLHKREASHTK